MIRSSICNSFRFNCLFIMSCVFFLICTCVRSIHEIVYDEPDSTIELDGNTVEWDLYDSVDLIERRLYKYALKAEHPKGHVYLDSLYREKEERIGDITTWILLTRTNSNVFLYGAGTDTTDNPTNPYHGNYNANKKSISPYSDLLGEWGPFRNKLTICVKIISDSDNNYFQLIFPESTRNFHFKQF